jgi:hypothetical protein
MDPENAKGAHMRKLVLFAAAAVLLCPRVAGAVSVYVEAESFVQSYNIEPENVRADGTVLRGLDYPGEWAEYQAAFTAFGTYAFTMRCWGNLNALYSFRLTTMPTQGEEPQTFNLNYIGRGTCGS